MLQSTADAETRLHKVLACDDMEAVLGVTLRGLGIACMPDFLAGESLAESQLVSVLEEQLSAGGRFSALWPSSRHLSSKVRVFVDHLVQQLSARP